MVSIACVTKHTNLYVPIGPIWMYNIRILFHRIYYVWDIGHHRWTYIHFLCSQLPFSNLLFFSFFFSSFFSAMNSLSPLLLLLLFCFMLLLCSRCCYRYCCLCTSSQFSCCSVHLIFNFCANHCPKCAYISPLFIFISLFSFFFFFAHIYACKKNIIPFSRCYRKIFKMICLVWDTHQSEMVWK